ncbi:6-phosphofructokinase [Niallia circulans]|uniref:6-phosphofructokinase n=1 Tax=Niallia circulans TaxID=1397 RepID=UPI00156146F7|nr:6-phosphofructokinase [Niallia circulans]NRG31797.1 6-phosphofructokinase [Niallia circulans]
MKVGIMIAGVLPGGVKQIIYKIFNELTPTHQLFGIEVNKETGKADYLEFIVNNDSPYLSDSLLKPTPLLDNIRWEEICSPMDSIIFIGDAQAKKRWAQTFAMSKTIHSLYVPVSIYNNIKGSDWSLGYDTAINSITQMVLKVKDTIHSLKYEKPRLFGFAINGYPSNHMLQDISMAVDGHFLANTFELEEVELLCNKIDNSFNSLQTSSVLVYSHLNKESVEKKLIRSLNVDWKYTEIDEALCMGTNPTTIDRILANEIAEIILLWIKNDNPTGEIAVKKEGVLYLNKKYEGMIV